MKLLTAFLITTLSYLFVHQLTSVSAYPALGAKRPSRGAQAGFPPTVEVVDNRPKNGCKVEVLRQHYDSLTQRLQNRTTFDCCGGYGGVECDQIVDPILAASPCSPLSCPNHPNATCAVFSRCGEDVPVFLSDTGDIVDCGSPNVTQFNVTSFSCSGLCPRDPCADLKCNEHPNAICLTVGCSCEPVWILETGVSVNCTTGASLTSQEFKRRRRQIESGNTETTASTLPSCES